MKIWDVTRGKQVEGDPKVSSTHRFKQLVFKFVRSIANVCAMWLKITKATNVKDSIVDVITEFQLS